MTSPKFAPQLPQNIALGKAPRRPSFLSRFRRTRLSANIIGRRLPEMVELEELIALLAPHAKVEVLAQVSARDQSFPVYGVTIGCPDPEAPVLGLFGGVHGLERIGSHVVLSFMQTISELIGWDESLHQKLEKVRLVFMPLVNPGGMFLRYRSNPRGVDLMRNAPVEASGRLYPLVSGQRISRSLPWYRGEPEIQLEIEAQALMDFVRRECFRSRLSVCLDVHSGFGSIDRLWFPYAKTTEPFFHLPEFAALTDLFDSAYPNHFYRIEPQAKQYATHGDLWDALYDEHRGIHQQNIFMPLCLEMGSWMWVKKNPWQIFSALGPFNPIQPHRHQRIMRRHLTLLDFLTRALYSPQRWAWFKESERAKLHEEALHRWYRGELTGAIDK